MTEMVQRHQGLRLHPAGCGQQGRFRPHLGRRARRAAEPGRRAEGWVRARYRPRRPHLGREPQLPL